MSGVSKKIPVRKYRREMLPVSAKFNQRRQCAFNTRPFEPTWPIPDPKPKYCEE